MKISNTIKSLIMEDSRFNNLYTNLVLPKEKAKEKGKSKGVIPFEILKQVIFADPTTRKPENFDIEGASVEDMDSDNVKVGKFTQWLLKNYVKPTNIGEPGSPEFKEDLKNYRRLFIEDLFKMSDVLTKFERIKVHLPEDQRDVNKLTPESLTDIITNLPEDIKQRLNKNVAKSDTKELRKDNKYAHAGAEILFTGSRYTVIKIEGTGDAQREAAGWYGGYFDYMNGESHWCTSPPTSSYFMTYASKGPLYVVLANDDGGKVGSRTGLPQERYQFHFPDSQFMDRMDKQIDLVAFLNGPASELKEVFKGEFAKGLVHGSTNRVEITIPSSRAGKYISLYGLEDLFYSLPKNIEHLLINNTTKDQLAFDVPDELGKFTNLEALLLINIVKSLPDSIGDLKELQFLTLSHNPSLDKLPETLADLPILSFITLKGANSNLVIPPRLAEKLSAESDGFYYVMNDDDDDE